MSQFVIEPKTASGAQNAVAAAIEDCVKEWVEAVNGGNAETIAALYMPDAVLLGTYAPKPCLTPAERLDYFINFKTRKKLQATVTENHIAVLDENAGVASGLYTFDFIDDRGAPQNVKARFSFAFSRQKEGDWLIAAHHSSVAPI